MSFLEGIRGRFGYSTSSGVGQSNTEVRRIQNSTAASTVLVPNSFEEAYGAQLTKTVYSHIAEKVGSLPRRYIKSNGMPGTNASVRRILEQLDDDDIGGFAADLKMMGNGLFFKVYAGGSEEVAKLEYRPAATVSPIIRVINGDYALVGWLPRNPSNTPNSGIVHHGHNGFTYNEPVAPAGPSIARITSNDSVPHFTNAAVIHGKIGRDIRYGKLLGDNLLLASLDTLNFQARARNHILGILKKISSVDAIVQIKAPEDGNGVRSNSAENRAALMADIAQKITEQYASSDSGLISVPVEVDVTQMGAPVNRLQLTGINEMPQFEFCAMFDVPAALAGQQAGLERLNWATLRTMRQYEYDTLTEPLARKIGGILTSALLPQGSDERIVLDSSGLSFLQDDIDTKVDRLLELMDAGIITEEQVKKELGYDQDS